MATYFIPKMFRLNRDDGSARFFAAGLQSFADDDKDVFHWYLLANARSPDDFDPGDVAALPADVAAAQMTFGKLEAKRAEQQAVDPRFQGLNERARAMGERAYAAAVAEADREAGRIRVEGHNSAPAAAEGRRRDHCMAGSEGGGGVVTPDQIIIMAIGTSLAGAVLSMAAAVGPRRRREN